MSAKKAAHENPLIPNARLRQMYRAILRAHLLGGALPPGQRTLTAGREAALVSTSMDLAARDLVLDALSGPVIDFLRGTPLHRIDLKNWVPHVSPLRRGKSATEAGSPSRLSSPSDPAARVHFALGAAAFLKSSAKLTRQNSESSAHDLPVIVVSSLPNEVPANAWKPALAFAAQHDLPIVFVVLPDAAARNAATRSAGSGDLRAVAHRAGVPAIPVDADDPVALYRVAQESIGHARIGGGPALIECIAFPAGRSGRTVLDNAALAHLERYILERGIATRAWMDREAASFDAQIRSLKSASK